MLLLLLRSPDEEGGGSGELVPGLAHPRRVGAGLVALPIKPRGARIAAADDRAKVKP